jgi:integrase
MVGKLIERVKRVSTYEVDPFDANERQAFLNACPTDEERDNYLFWFETGLRPGELIALAWPSVDWIKGRVRIDTNIVDRIEKGPKTDAGIRDIELTPKALDALIRQKARTFLAGGRVWRSPKTMKPWETDGQIRRTSYNRIMIKAGVRHRNMYQIRHTFASTHASSGRNLFWLAGQMGHETIEVLIRHYARWIPGNDAQSDNQIASNGNVVGTQRNRSNIISINTKR